VRSLRAAGNTGRDKYSENAVKEGDTRELGIIDGKGSGGTSRNGKGDLERGVMGHRSRSKKGIGV